MNNMNTSPQDPIFSYQPLWGSWTIDSLIGEGSYGKVYKATRTDMSHTFTSAIKIIRIPSNEQYKQALSSFGDDMPALKVYFEEIADYILNEINLLYKLRSNPNIITYEDHMVKEKEDPLTWDIIIRMEYSESLTLYLSKKMLNREQIIRLGIDICSAIDACVKNNIIHRDIKDENIFISKNNIFKLGDFGIAKELSKSGKAASSKGTPIFMSPEVFFGKKYDIRSDIYSLGIVMYKLLNKGRVPFMPPYPDKVTYASSEASMTKRLSGENFPFPTHSGKILGDIVLKACSFKKEDRYSTSLEMRQELIKALNIIDSESLNENVTFLYGEDKQGKETGTVHIFNLPKAQVNKEEIIKDKIIDDKTVQIAKLDITAAGDKSKVNIKEEFSVKEHKEEEIIKDNNIDDKPIQITKSVITATDYKSKDEKEEELIPNKLPREVKTDTKENSNIIKDLKEQKVNNAGNAIKHTKLGPDFKENKKRKKMTLLYSIIAVIILAVIITASLLIKNYTGKAKAEVAIETNTTVVNLAAGPVIIKPSDNFESAGETPLLEWKGDNSSISYFVTVSSAKAGEISSGWIASTSFKPNLPNDSYSWKVKAKNKEGAESGWSSESHFTIVAAAAETTASAPETTAAETTTMETSTTTTIVTEFNNKIAYLKNTDKYKSIFIMDLINNKEVEIKLDMYWQEFYTRPAWSLDGSTIVIGFGMDLYAINMLDNSVKNIYTLRTVRVDDEDSIKNRGYFGKIAWSPDSQKILFTISNDQYEVYLNKFDNPEDEAVSNRIMIINKDGTNPQIIIENHELKYNGINWSADGSKIVYSTGKSATNVVVDADGNRTEFTNKNYVKLNFLDVLNNFESKQIIEYPGWVNSYDGGKFIANCDWSPDGKSILFDVVGDTLKEYKTYIVDSDGKNAKELFNGYGPVWSFDGKQIMYSGIEYNDTYELPILLANSSGTDSAIIGWGVTPTWYITSKTTVAAETTTAEKVDYAIGDTGPAGGLIFYINPNSATDGWRYLEASPSGYSKIVKWQDGKYLETGAIATEIGTGKANTQKIVDIQGDGSYAAKLCNDLIIGGYDDWFLPSKDELNAMYRNLQLNGLGSFESDSYWSSSEYSLDSAYGLGFDDGGQYYGLKDDGRLQVRAIRAFN